MESAESVLSQLDAVLEARKGQNPDSSYAAHLFAAGDDTILQKVGEEAVEFILAAKSGDQAHTVCEAADVWFHMLVMLARMGLDSSDVISELQRRMGTSGHAEKASRDTTNTRGVTKS